MQITAHKVKVEIKRIEGIKNIIAVTSGKGGVGKSTVAFNLEIMSFGFLINENQPAIWRGAIVTKALNQLMFDTKWGELDFLVMDMPPGTGDIHLTMCQKMPITATIVVTT